MILSYLGFINCGNQNYYYIIFQIENNLAYVFDNFSCFYLSAFWAIIGAKISIYKNFK